MEKQLEELRSEMATMQAKQDRALRSMKDEVLGLGLAYTRVKSQSYCSVVATTTADQTGFAQHLECGE